MKVRKKRLSSLREAAESSQKPVSLENFVDIAYDAIVCLDAERRISFWNPAAERIYGWTAAEVLGKTQAEVAAMQPALQEPQDQQERQPPLQREDGTFQAEQKLRRKDGSLLWVEYTARTILNADGTLAGYVTTSRDITEHKQAQHALTEYARQQEALYQFTDQLHHTNSMDDIFNAALDGIINALGCDRASILLFDDSGVIHFVAWRGLSEAYRKATDGHSPWKQDEKFPMPICVSDVPSADFSDDLKAVIQQEGISSLAFIPLDTSRALIGKFMVYYDQPHTFITSEVELSLTMARQLAFGVERKRSEEKLRTSEALYRAIVRSIPGSGVYVVNKDMRYIVAEGVVSEAFGLSREMLEGHTLSEIFNEEITARMEERFRRNFAGETISYEIKRNDKVYWIQQTPLLDSMGDALVVTMDITAHKRVEQELRASKERYQNLFDLVPLAVYTCDAEGVITEFNQHSVELWGRKPEPSERFCGSFKIYYPDGTFMPHEECPMSRVLRGETLQPHEFEILVERPDGQRRNIVAHPRVLRNEAGEVVEAVNCLYDITEERRAEGRASLLVQMGELVREMTDPDEFLYAVSKAVGDHLQVQRTMFVEIDQTGDRGFVHRDYCRDVPSVAGQYRLSEYSNETTHEMEAGFTVVNNDSKIDPRTATYYEKTYGPNGERAYVAVPLLRDGKWVATFWVSTNVPREWAEEDVALLGTIAERAWLATEKMRLDRALRQSEERFVLFMQHLPGLAWIKDLQGRYIYANDAAEKAFNVSGEKLYGSTDHDIFPVETAAQFRHNDQLALQEGRGVQVVEVLKQDDDVLHYSLVSKFPIPGSDGKPSLIGGTAFDITERIEAENALRENQAELKALNETLEQKVQERTLEVRKLASELTKAEQRERHRIAHILHDDLQQRLYAIKMHTGLLGNKLDRHDAKLMYDLADVKEQLDDAIVVTRQLSVDISPPILKDEGLAHAIGWLVSQMKEQHGLQVELQADGPFVIPDEDMQVLLFNSVRELLFNVVKHAGVKQAVVALQRSNADLKIEVRDRGKGFALGTAFGQAIKAGDEGDYRKPSFGLPTLRHRISLFGGRMDVDSTPGSGTQILLTIPVYSQGATLRQ